MLTVNLFDAAFAHLTGSSVHGKVAKRIRYVRSRLKWDGITLITDAMLIESRVLEHLESKVKIGWLMEPREYRPHTYDRVAGVLPKLDLLLTHDQWLLDAYPAKARRVPFGGCWVQEANFGLHPKDRPLSMIYSAKSFMPGHLLRHQVAARFPEIRLFGGGSTTPIALKEYGLQRFAFSVAIENSRARNFFTEKLLDCFAVGTVPIYWGCPNLEDFGFDMRGVIPFEDIEELPTIFAGLDYERHLEGAKANLEAFRPFEVTDDWLASNILEGLV